MGESVFFFKTEALSVGYDGRAVISDIELGIKQGEILSIIGPNGAGKTTFLKSIIRQLTPISGVVVLDGRIMSDIGMKELARQMSVVLTERPKTELMTVWDIVATGRYPYTGNFGVLGNEDKRIIMESMELVRIGTWADKDFSKISDGQKQRVMLARALAQQPKIIVLDEPTSFLDIKYKLEFLSILKELSESRNMTVIMSLHEVELARIISDKIGCIKDGGLDRFGSPKEVFSDNYLIELFDIDYGKLTGNFESMLLRMANGE